MTDTWDTIKVEPERDRFGRYVIHPAKGGKPKSYTRATTVAETLDDRYNLEAWKVRTTALGIVQRPDLYAAIASTPADEKQRLNKLCDQAREAAAGSAGANLGTALHRFTERLNRGEDVVVPAPWDADINAYMSALDASRYHINEKYLERIVVVEKIGVAGMFDLILTDGIDAWIADLKTGATLDFSWGAIAVQLALYAHADTLYDPQSKTHEAMPAVDQEKAIVIHLPAGKATCTLYEVDIAAGWEAAQHALWAREWRKKKGLATPCFSSSASASPSSAASAQSSSASTTADATIVGGGEQAPALTVEPAPPADVTRRTALVDRVKALRPEQLTELAAKWPIDVPTFKAFDGHTDEQLDAIDTVVTWIDLGGDPPPLVPVEPLPESPDPDLPPAAVWEEPDGGERLNDEAYEFIRNRYMSQPDDVRTLVSQWADEAHAAGRGFSPRDNRTERRATILGAAIRCAAEIGDPEVVKAVVGYIMNGQVWGVIGRALGSMTLDEARRLALFVEHFGKDITLTYDEDGAKFAGDGLAAVAA